MEKEPEAFNAEPSSNNKTPKTGKIKISEETEKAVRQPKKKKNSSLVKKKQTVLA